MITLLVLFLLPLVFMLIVALITGLIEVLPIVLVVISLPLIDYFVFKKIFGKKKKDD